MAASRLGCRREMVVITTISHPANNHAPTTTQPSFVSNPRTRPTQPSHSRDPPTPTQPCINKKRRGKSAAPVSTHRPETAASRPHTDYSRADRVESVAPLDAKRPYSTLMFSRKERKGRKRIRQQHQCRQDCPFDSSSIPAISEMRSRRGIRLRRSPIRRSASRVLRRQSARTEWDIRRPL